MTGRAAAIAILERGSRFAADRKNATKCVEAEEEVDSERWL